MQCKSPCRPSQKFAIIGAGFVGSTTAYALMLDGVASEIALIDINKNKVKVRC
jgi:L-lactate dehydrogenase